MPGVGSIGSTGKVQTVRPDQTINEAARMLTYHNIGAVPVVSGEKLVGILSERDLISRVMALQKDPEKMRVEEVMTPSPVTVEAGAPLHSCLELMARHHCRHLPILENGKLVGILSLRDVLEKSLASVTVEKQSLEELQQREFDQ